MIAEDSGRLKVGAGPAVVATAEEESGRPWESDLVWPGGLYVLDVLASGRIGCASISSSESWAVEDEDDRTVPAAGTAELVPFITAGASFRAASSRIAAVSAFGTAVTLSSQLWAGPLTHNGELAEMWWPVPGRCAHQQPGGGGSGRAPGLHVGGREHVAHDVAHVHLQPLQVG